MKQSFQVASRPAKTLTPLLRKSRRRIVSSLVPVALLLSCLANPGLALAGENPSLLNLVATNAEARVDVIGRTYLVPIESDDTLHTIARRYHSGLQELQIANPDIDTWLPDLSANVVVPAQYVLPSALTGTPSSNSETLVVINLPELRLYLRHHGVITTYPVSVGKPGWATPTTETRITEKKVDPLWRPPLSVIEAAEKRGEKIAPLYLPGPSNPLGKYAIRLGHTAYLIHGTNKPSGVGLRVSHGCVRMFPEHVEVLFGRVQNRDKVVVVDEPIKLGWLDGELYMEIHPPLQENELDDEQLLENAISLAVHSLGNVLAGLNEQPVGEGSESLAMELLGESGLASIAAMVKQKSGLPAKIQLAPPRLTP